MVLVSKKAKYILAGAFLLAIVSSLATAGLTGSLSQEAIVNRLQPMGQVNIDGVDATESTGLEAAAGLGGPEKIYADNCKLCHQTGLAGAPKFGDKSSWGPRLDEGLDTMVQNAWNGIRAMPPKGNCLKCSKEDIKETVQYMLDQLG